MSGSLGNIAKPLVESSVQQILPFKLSEATIGDGGTSGSSLRKSGSPKPASYQKLEQSRGKSPSSSQKQSHDHQLEVSHQRTGSSPALIPPNQQGARGGGHTLPKSSSIGASDAREQQQHKVNYNSGNAEDKVIYF